MKKWCKRQEYRSCWSFNRYYYFDPNKLFYGCWKEKLRLISKIKLRIILVFFFTTQGSKNCCFKIYVQKTPPFSSETSPSFYGKWEFKNIITNNVCCSNKKCFCLEWKQILNPCPYDIPFLLKTEKYTSL